MLDYAVKVVPILVGALAVLAAVRELGRGGQWRRRERHLAALLESVPEGSRQRAALEEMRLVVVAQLVGRETVPTVAAFLPTALWALAACTFFGPGFTTARYFAKNAKNEYGYVASAFDGLLPLVSSLFTLMFIALASGAVHVGARYWRMRGAHRFLVGRQVEMFPTPFVPLEQLARTNEAPEGDSGSRDDRHHTRLERHARRTVILVGGGLTLCSAAAGFYVGLGAGVLTLPQPGAAASPQLSVAMFADLPVLMLGIVLAASGRAGLNEMTEAFILPRHFPADTPDREDEEAAEGHSG